MASFCCEWKGGRGRAVVGGWSRGRDAEYRFWVDDVSDNFGGVTSVDEDAICARAGGGHGMDGGEDELRDGDKVRGNSVDWAVIKSSNGNDVLLPCEEGITPNDTCGIVSHDDSVKSQPQTLNYLSVTKTRYGSPQDRDLEEIADRRSIQDPRWRFLFNFSISIGFLI